MAFVIPAMYLIEPVFLALGIESEPAEVAATFLRCSAFGIPVSAVTSSCKDETGGDRARTSARVSLVTSASASMRLRRVATAGRC